MGFLFGGGQSQRKDWRKELEDNDNVKRRHDPKRKPVILTGTQAATPGGARKPLLAGQ